MKGMFCFGARNYVKAAVSVVLVAWYFLMPRYCFPDDGVTGHVLYPLCHANIFHLMANILCLWMMRCRLHLVFSFLLSVLCSFLPCLVPEPTMGFSGVLFSALGMSWGNAGRFKDMLWRNKWLLIVPMFIPHVNGFIHLYCLLAGYFVCKSFWGKMGNVGLMGVFGRVLNTDKMKDLV